MRASILKFICGGRWARLWGKVMIATWRANRGCGLELEHEKNFFEQPAKCPRFQAGASPASRDRGGAKLFHYSWIGLGWSFNENQVISRTKKGLRRNPKAFSGRNHKFKRFFRPKTATSSSPKIPWGARNKSGGALPPRWRRACFQVIILALVETRITLIAARPCCFVCQVKYRLRQIRFMSSSCLRNPHGKAAAGIDERVKRLKILNAPIFFKPLIYHYRLTKTV